MIIYKIYDNIFEKPERDIKENKEFIDKWKQSNIDYLKKVDCAKFIENSKEVKIEKFYTLWTSHEVKCEEIGQMFQDFSNSRFGINNIDLKFNNHKFDQFKSQTIDSANVLIWVKTIPGDLEGRYQGGSRAIRLNNEINFIETKTNIVYKKVIVKCIGEPLKEVMEGHTEKSNDYYFGTYSNDEIAKVVENELSKN